MDKSIVRMAGFLVLMGLLLSSAALAQKRQASFTEREVIELIKNSKGHLKDAANDLERRGVNFDLDVKIETKLRKAGADEALLQAVWKASPAGRASQKAILATATGTQLQITPKEGTAFQAMQNEIDPDRRLLQVEAFARDYPSSPILSEVYAQGAKAYQEKGNLNKAVEYGEKSVQADPDNLPALLVVAVSLSQPSMLQGNETEKAMRLAEAQHNAERVLKLLEGMTKHTSETEEQFELRKRGLAADAHFALGMTALMRDDPPKGVNELKAAINNSSKPTAQYYYRLGDAYSTVGKTDAAIESYKKAAELGRGTAMEQMANRHVAELKEGKP